MIAIPAVTVNPGKCEAGYEIFPESSSDPVRVLFWAIPQACVMLYRLVDPRRIPSPIDVRFGCPPVLLFSPLMRMCASRGCDVNNVADLPEHADGFLPPQLLLARFP